MSKAIRSCPSPSPAQGQEPQGSSDCSHAAWNTSHPPSAPHPTPAQRGRGRSRDPSPAGNLWPKEGLRCPLPTRESSGTVILRQRSTPASLKGLPLGSLTAVTPTRKKGRRDPPVDSLSTPAEVEQPQPLRVAAWLGTVEPLLRPALGRLGHAQPSNGASDVGLQPRPWRPAPPPRPRDAPSA